VCVIIPTDACSVDVGPPWAKAWRPANDDVLHPHATGCLGGLIVISSTIGLVRWVLCPMVVHVRVVLM